MNGFSLKALALSGGDWVIYGLFLCSSVAAAVIIERGIILRRELRQLEALSGALLKGLAEEDLTAVEKAVSAHPGSASRILQAGLAKAHQSPAGVEDHLVAATLSERRFIEHRLIILGTLGNNAPFVGLFGTVLGVIRAFSDLAAQSAAGPEVVMQGLSEALIATAVGLLVAIPCVVGYNYFQKRAKDLFMGTEALGRMILAQIRSGKAATRR
jgi:biopolymer transport protein ExbB